MSTLNQNDLGLTDLGLTDASCSCGSQAHKSESIAESSGTTTTTTLQVAGMTCGHCVNSVTAELGRVAGVEAVAVQLVPGGVSLVTVSSAAPLDGDAVAAAIDEAGYELVPASS